MLDYHLQWNHLRVPYPTFQSTGSLCAYEASDRAPTIQQGSPLSVEADSQTSARVSKMKPRSRSGEIVDWLTSVQHGITPFTEPSNKGGSLYEQGLRTQRNAALVFSSWETLATAKPKKVEWSQPVREYVVRAFDFDNSVEGITVAQVKEKTKEIIRYYAERNMLESIDWEDFPLPQQLLAGERKAALAKNS